VNECVTTNEQFFSYIMVITSFIGWYDDDVCSLY